MSIKKSETNTMIAQTANLLVGDDAHIVPKARGTTLVR